MRTDGLSHSKQVQLGRFSCWTSYSDSGMMLVMDRLTGTRRARRHDVVTVQKNTSAFAKATARLAPVRSSEGLKNLQSAKRSQIENARIRSEEAECE
jgi:hypothetical protein